MKRLVLAMLVLLIAAGANAQTIYDIQTGLVAENTQVQLVNVVVVAERYNGIYVSEAPHGAYNGMWVYSGAAPGATVGDVVNIQGEYYEYYDLSEVDTQAGIIQVVGSAAVPAPSVVPAAALVADYEAWESCQITIPDMMTVTTAPSSYGEWFATTDGGEEIMFDDYWYDDTTVVLGDCYTSVTGCLNYNFSAFKLEVFADGITMCPVAEEVSTFGTVKSLFR
jgi:hypothetical protein